MATSLRPLEAITRALEDGAVKGGCDCSECAQAVLDAIPDRWMKWGGEWLRMVQIDVVDDDGETLTCWAEEGAQAR